MNVVFFLYLFAFSNTVECYRSDLTKVLDKVRETENYPAPEEKIKTENVKEKWISQKIDHFSKTNKERFKMRYLRNKEYFTWGGPLFIQVGGMGMINSDPLEYGLFHDIAKKNNGYLVYLEHRFYGKSQPFSELTIEGLKYLSSSQVLRDLAHFVRHMKKRHLKFRNSKVVLMGISYAGALVTWFRRKYPKLADAVWAASAPLSAKVNFKEFKVSVGQTFKKVGNKNCYLDLDSSYYNTDFFLMYLPFYIENRYSFCSNFNNFNEDDFATFFYTVTSYLEMLVLKKNFKEIKNLCEYLAIETYAFVGFREWLLDHMITEKKCYDFTVYVFIQDLDYKKPYDNSTKEYKMMRQWFYQKCTEFGWFQTTDSKNQPFGRDVDLIFFMQVCNKLFWTNYNTNTIYEIERKTNKVYGGANINVTRVVFTYGELDPWNILGMAKDKATFISDYGHGQETFPIRINKDSFEMLKAKNHVKSQLEYWINH